MTGWGRAVGQSQCCVMHVCTSSVVRNHRSFVSAHNSTLSLCMPTPLPACPCQHSSRASCKALSFHPSQHTSPPLSAMRALPCAHAWVPTPASTPVSAPLPVQALLQAHHRPRNHKRMSTAPSICPPCPCSHYRKRTISSMPTLNYLDDAPVFPKDRRLAQAFCEGGLEAERRWGGGGVCVCVFKGVEGEVRAIDGGWAAEYW